MPGSRLDADSICQRHVPLPTSLVMADSESHYSIPRKVPRITDPVGIDRRGPRAVPPMVRIVRLYYSTKDFDENVTVLGCQHLCKNPQISLRPAGAAGIT